MDMEGIYQVIAGASPYQYRPNSHENYNLFDQKVYTHSFHSFLIYINAILLWALLCYIQGLQMLDKKVLNLFKSTEKLTKT